MRQSIEVSFNCYGWEDTKCSLNRVAAVDFSFEGVTYQYCKGCGRVHQVFFDGPTISIDPTEEFITPGGKNA